jgi:hypothetical protein
LLAVPAGRAHETEADVARDLAEKDVYIGFFNGLLAIGAVRVESLPGGVAYISRFAVSPNWQSSGRDASCSRPQSGTARPGASGRWRCTPPSA